MNDLRRDIAELARMMDGESVPEQDRLVILIQQEFDWVKLGCLAPPVMPK